MNDTNEIVLQLIRDELGQDAASVSLDTPLSDLGDSLSWVSLLCEVESTFGIRIDTERGMSLHTVRDLVILLQESRRETA
ncbi:MAG: acyl carrier protein [Burkholderiaceae bacterium]